MGDDRNLLLWHLAVAEGREKLAMEERDLSAKENGRERVGEWIRIAIER